MLVFVAATSKKAKANPLPKLLAPGVLLAQFFVDRLFTIEDRWGARGRNASGALGWLLFRAQFQIDCMLPSQRRR